MGNSKIWYYPDGDGGTLEEIDFGENRCLTQIVEMQITEGADAYNGSGRLFRTTTRSMLRMRFVSETWTDDTGKLQRELLTLERHLHRGGAISLAEDSDKAWASFALDSDLARGTKEVMVGSNLFSTYAGITLLALDDEVVIHSPLPEMNREWAVLDDASSQVLELRGPGTKYAYSQGPIFVRHRDFHPVLRMGADGLGVPTLTHDHRLVFTWDVTLFEDPSAIAALYTGTGGLGLNSDTAAERLGTLDEIINEAYGLGTERDTSGGIL